MAEAEAPKGSVPYSFFKSRHPKYDQEYWARCRSFYRGGKWLLENKAVMDRIFPKHTGESDHIYNLRRKSSHYVNYSGQLVNHILAKLLVNPLRLECHEDTDDYYPEFWEDVSPPGGKKKTIQQLIRDLMLTAFQCKTAYALVELPGFKGDFATLAEQEQSGQLDLWCVEVQPESVIDWEEDSAGELEWVLLMFPSAKRKSLADSRDFITEDYWYYNRQGWVKWSVTYHKEKPPVDSQMISPVGGGTHTFGKVPLVRLDLPDGLWVMSKLESLAREHFLKRNALSWAELKALLPVLYEFLDPGIMPTLSGPAGEEDRAVSQTRSVAHVQQRQAAAGGGDHVEWIGPPDGPFSHALASAESTRDEMHRVVYEMALAADNSAMLAQRSGKSKARDEAALSVVLEAYGDIAREAAVAVAELVSLGRGDLDYVWTATGMSDFDYVDVHALVEEEVLLDSVDMPSPTFRLTRKIEVVKQLLGDSASEEDIEAIRQELEAYYSPESQPTREELEEQRQDTEETEESEDSYDEREQAVAAEKRTGMVISTFKGSKA